MIRFNKLMAAVCVVCLLLTCLQVCTASAAGTGRAPADYTGRIVDLRLDEAGYLQITRELAKNEPMGEENTWTIFCYFCGSDLETKDGSATSDLQEMIDGSVNSSVRYIVLTGGSLKWQNPLVDASVLEIYLIENGEMTLLTSSDYYYMNDADTLRAFLGWGVSNYPADKMGLIFWDHGGGSINGVCVDEIFYNDIETGVLEDISGYSSTLTLPMIADVLADISDGMTDQFEFIGYDACLMGTMENAYILSPYARYMYASQEIEPGYGWDYVAIGEAIGASGSIDGAELGKVVCDSYYDSCHNAGQEKNSTFACVDLRLADDLILAFDTFSRNLLEVSEEPNMLAKITQNVSRVEFFGGNSREEGYRNAIDLAGFVSAVSLYVDGAEELLNVLDRTVVCSRNGIYHRNACGLSVYYPLHVDPGSSELGSYAKVAFSPYYYGYVAQNAYAAANGGMDGYDVSYSLNVWSSTVDSNAETIVECYDGTESSGQSTCVQIYDGPLVLDDGTYAFSLTYDSLPYVSTVEADIFFLSDDGEDLVYLGSTNDITADWEEGIFKDNFDGLWFCMPNGQIVSAYVVSETEEYAIYTTPVILNGEETNLRFVVNYSDYSVTLDGIWSGSDENGMADRNTERLQPGDVIQPRFGAVNLETDEQYPYYGEEYVYDGSDEWYYNELFDTTYLYRFCIYDIYGGSIATDGVFFTIEDGAITSSLIEEEAAAEEQEENSEIVATIAYQNETGVQIHGLYISSALSDSWGENIFEGIGPLEDATKRTYENAFRYTADDLIWDIKIADVNGNALEFKGLNMANAADPQNILIMLTVDAEENTYTASVN